MPSLEATLDELTELAHREKALQARRQELLDNLDQLVEAGEAEEAMEWNDCKITRRARKSYTYPDHILDQRQQLKAAEQLAVALGEAEELGKLLYYEFTTSTGHGERVDAMGFARAVLARWGNQ